MWHLLLSYPRLHGLHVVSHTPKLNFIPLQNQVFGAADVQIPLAALLVGQPHRAGIEQPPASQIPEQRRVCMPTDPDGLLSELRSQLG